MEISLVQKYFKDFFNYLKCFIFVCIVTILLIFYFYQQPVSWTKSQKRLSRNEKVQKQRLATLEAVCEKYKNDLVFNTAYVEKPGEKMKGKFTLEPRGKMVMCNTMKQGTTTWARIFLQLYLPKAVNWSKQSPQFSPFSVGYQVKLQQVQRKRFSQQKKTEIIKSLESRDHKYFGFLVCRNPIEKLKSLYTYSLDLGRFRRGRTPKNFKDFITQSFSRSSPLSKSSIIILELRRVFNPEILEPKILLCLSVISTSGRRSSRSAFGWSNDNDVSGHYK